MAKLRPLERIFSITNSGTDKLITIFGLEIRIDQSKYYRQICETLPIDENKIVIDNFNGNSYGCNPKYIVEEILKRKLPYEIVWLVKNVKKETNANNFPEGIRLVGIGSKQALKELASAKIWIDNQRKNYFLKKGLRKKEGQYYIQTWHGSFGIKKLDADVKAFNQEWNQEWVKRAKYESSIMDYLITNSTFDDKVLTHGLWFHNEIKRFGHPRNDVFFRNQEEIKNKVYDFYGIPKDKKVLLYVPSFRDDYSIDCYKLDYEKILKAMEEKFGGEWICIARLHPRAKKFDKELIPESSKIVDGTFYPDIQELLVAGNVAVTDYSSCIYDFLLTGKPGFIFATDIEKYNNDRGFYFPLESTPFPIATNNQEFIKNIECFDNSLYTKKVEEFLKEKGSMEDGNASKRVVDLIEELMNKDKKNE